MEENLDTFSEDTAQFDAYLRNEMPPELRTAFEARLAADTPFRRAFDLHRALLGSLNRNAEREQWRQRLRDTRNTLPPEQARPVACRWWLLALLLVLAGGLYWFWSQNNPKPVPEPSVPIADQGGSQQDPYSAAGLEHLDQALPVVRVAMRNGAKTATTDAGMATMEVYRTQTSGMSGNFRNNRVQLYLPEKQYQSPETYRLVLLDMDGTETAYLQIGTDFFPLSAEDAWLQKVTDPTVLRWLQ